MVGGTQLPLIPTRGQGHTTLATAMVAGAPARVLFDHIRQPVVGRTFQRYHILTLDLSWCSVLHLQSQESVVLPRNTGNLVSKRPVCLVRIPEIPDDDKTGKPFPPLRYTCRRVETSIVHREGKVYQGQGSAGFKLEMSDSYGEC